LSYLYVVFCKVIKSVHSHTLKENPLLEKANNSKYEIFL
jgi:hypothetical protein